MDNKLYFRLGLLSAGTVLLLVGMLFYLGLAEHFAPRIHFVTFFRESVQGLAVGSAVKYKGVPIGSVSNISIRTGVQLIQVDMMIDPKVFIDAKNPDMDQFVEVFRFCEKERNNGLCCRLDMAGVTGMRYVEMDYLAQTEGRLEPPKGIIDCACIAFPSVPSTFTNIVDTVATSLEKIAEVDFGGISRSLEKNLHDLNELLGDPALKRTITKVEAIAEHVEITSRNLSENLTGEELRKIFDGLNRNLDTLSEITVGLRQKLEESRFQDVVLKIGETADSVRDLAEQLNQTRRDFSWTLRQLNALMGSAEELVDYLRSDPNAILRGKTVPPVRQVSQER